MEKILDKKEGFNLGWDWAHHGLNPPDGATEMRDFMQGYNQAFLGTRKRESDRYVRKWLLLRYNAWRRNRAFSKEVTPDFIRFIDVKRCPITNVELTHGTKLDSDWSVDRICNDSAYAPGNLVVVSAFANKAKGSYSAKDMSQLAMGDLMDNVTLKKETGLNVFEWRRWFLIASMALPNDKPGHEGKIAHVCAPCVLPPPPGVILSPSAMIQLMVTDTVHSHRVGPAYAKLQKALEPEKRAELAKIQKQADRVNRKMDSSSTLDIWHNMSLFSNFSDLYRSIKMDDVIGDACDHYLHSVLGAVYSETPIDFGEWRNETKGFASAKPSIG